MLMLFVLNQDSACCCLEITGMKPPATWLANFFKWSFWIPWPPIELCGTGVQFLRARESIPSSHVKVGHSLGPEKKGSFLWFVEGGIKLLAFMRLEDFVALPTQLCFSRLATFFCFQSSCRSLSMPSAASTFCRRQGQSLIDPDAHPG